MSPHVLDEPLSIRQLEVFVTLVDEGSFTRAARHLDLSQSTVSGHIADLERRLGARVVERARSGVRPTAAGEALLAPARRTLEAERSSRQAVEELTGLLRGRLVVGGSTIPATYLLPASVAALRERHPGLRLRVVTGDSRDILDRVLAADVEVGIVGSAPEQTGLVSEVVAEDRLVLILPAGHALASRDRLRAAEVAALPLVLREAGSGTREASLAMLEHAGAACAPDDLDVVCEVGSTEACKAAVRAGLGASFVSSLAVGDEIAAGVLATVPVEGFEVPRAFHLVTRETAHLSPAARALREIVLERRRS